MKDHLEGHYHPSSSEKTDFTLLDALLETLADGELDLFLTFDPKDDLEPELDPDVGLDLGGTGCSICGWTGANSGFF